MTARLATAASFVVLSIAALTVAAWLVQPRSGLFRNRCAWYGMCMFSQRTQVLLSPAQLARLKRIATQERRSVGAVIRDAVDAYTSETTTAEERRAALEHLLSLNAPVDDWTVMKRQIEESRYPPVEGLP